MTYSTHTFSVVTLVVALSAPFAFCQPAATTWLEENDPTITYSGNWYSNPSSLNSGGRAALTNSLGASAALTFTGTGITWIGVKDPWSGFSRVYLDGTLNTIDTYGDTTQYQQPLFTVRGLTAGTHTLTIEVAHSRDPYGSGSWVWIDGFVVENGSGVDGGAVANAGRVEQNNAALTYNGTWYLNTNPDRSGGTAVLAIDPGSRATVSFNGTSIKWIGYSDEWSGIARVYVDGALKGNVDTYHTPSQNQSVVYSIDSLPAGVHTLSIEVAGTHNPNSAGSWIWVDGFDIGNN